MGVSLIVGGIRRSVDDPYLYPPLYQMWQSPTGLCCTLRDRIDYRWEQIILLRLGTGSVQSCIVSPYIHYGEGEGGGL